MAGGAEVSAVEGWWLLLDLAGHNLAVSVDVVDKVYSMPLPDERLRLPGCNGRAGEALVLGGRPVFLVPASAVLGESLEQEVDSEPAMCVVLEAAGFELALGVNEIAGPGGLALIEEPKPDEVLSGLGVLENRQVRLLDCSTLVREVDAAFLSAWDPETV